VDPSLEAASAPSWRARPRKSFFALSATLTVVVASGGARAANAPERSAEPARLAAQSLLIAVARAGPRLVAVGDRGVIVLSDDRGRSWVQASGVPTQALLTGVCFLDAEHGVAVGHDEVILVTADAGRTWKRTHYAPEAQRPLLDVWCGSGARAIAVGAYSAYFVSEDGGASWVARPFTPAPPPARRGRGQGARSGGVAPGAGAAETQAAGGYHLNRIVSASDSRLYIAAEAGHLYRSEDGGTRWAGLDSPYEGSFFGLLPLEDDALLAFGLRGNLYRSEDAGSTWRKIPTGTVAMLDGAARFDGQGVAIVGLSGVVLASEDGGRTFRLLQQADRAGLSAVVGLSDEELAVAGEDGARLIKLRAAPAGAATGP
jgi:photosystem II stability/assembly factor-like uncharacterized protein